MPALTAGDDRAVGAAVGLGLALALVVVAGLLVAAGVTQAWGFVLAGMIGCVLGPGLGWRHGPDVARGGRDDWAREALGTVVLVEGGLIAAWAFAGIVGQAPEGGLLGALTLAGYTLLMGAIVAGVANLIVLVPLGIVWARIVRRVAGRRRTAAPA